MEYFDVLDADGQKTGETKLRSLVHRDGDWHYAVQIWLVNDQNEVLLQRRAADKDSYPGLFDISCAGHVVAGETPIAAAVAELNEEIGLVVSPNNLELLGQYKEQSRPAPDFINNSFYDLYLLRRNFEVDQLHFQRSEISEIVTMSAKFLRAQLQEPVSAREFVPHLHSYQKLFQVLGLE